MDKVKEAHLSANTSQNFSLVWMRFLVSTGPTSHLSSFVSMWYNYFILTKYWNVWSVLKSSMKQNCKPLSKCRWPAPTKNFPKQQIISRTEQRYISRTAINGNKTDTRLDLFIASWITTHLLCSSCRSTSVSTGTSNNQILCTKSGMLWSAYVTLVW